MTSLGQPGKEYGRPPQAKLVMSAMLADVSLEGAVIRVLEEGLGEVDLVSERLRFDHTRYYEREMGGPLHRRVISFRRLVEADALVDIKLKSQVLEDYFRDARGRRRVNLDPGVLGLDNLVLATHKGYAHRIYLGRGVYGDLALIYRKGGFRALEWTYPDYASEAMLRLMDQIRAVLVWQRRRFGGGDTDAF